MNLQKQPWEFWAPQLSPEQGHTGYADSRKLAQTWGLQHTSAGAAPWPTSTLGISEILSLPDRPFSELGSPCHSAPSLTQLPYLEGRAGSLGCISGPPAVTKVLTAVLLPSGLWEASQNKTMQSYNHTPFFLEHKSFFCNPHP